MKYAAAGCIILLVLATAGHARLRARPQAQATKPAAVDQEPHHQLMYATPDIQIYDVVVPPNQSALMYPQNNNYVSISLTSNNVTINSPGASPLSVNLPGGAVQFATGGTGYTLTNDDSQPYEAMAIEFINSALTSRGCSCAGGAADSICNCPNAPPLPPDWSFEIGRVSLRGVTLSPGGTYNDDSAKATRFLVPVTPLDALDNTVHEPKSLEVRLPVGEYHWLGPGPHEIQNLGSSPLRFVCVEF